MNGLFSRRSRRLRRQKTVSANESAKADAADNAEKDSYHIVECCSCLYNKSVREHACCSLFALCHFLALSFLARSLFVLCSFLMCLTAILTEIKETKESCLS